MFAPKASPEPEVIKNQFFTVAGDDNDIADSGFRERFDDVIQYGLAGTGSITLGLLTVKGRSRFPSPAASMTACLIALTSYFPVIEALNLRPLLAG